ncbi:MAG TPA: KTSC domain-containing protein [Chthoniobacterales bacterium]|nr:KTSC domain-containing protein [Chthoniobacterales bacterium]
MRAKILASILFLYTSQLSANSLGNNTASPARTAVTSHIPRERVASKVIASVGYSKRRQILEIEFVNGAVYRYLQVAPSVYRDLIAADSKARYYDINIKGNYPSVRVRPRVKQKRY